ncbi:hypothetical protein P43SY_005389 [Pythium insidiosum]|uniref:RRM domain-containing protein n=1 Tax=Pythium insidiosum TaxID=114742 RepID=A0AAD5Q5N0_PYTIN|nr:hypothetical protein P43SY_005389 [Pythium insidiosum]
MVVDATADAACVRMYVGGLARDVTRQELTDRFGRLATSGQCRLTGIEMPADRLTPADCRGFAYLTIEGPQAASVMEQIAKAYNRTKWRGSLLRVEPAKPAYRERLEAEWAAVRAAQEARRQAAAEKRAEALFLPENREKAMALAQATGVQELRVGVEFGGTRRTTFDDYEADEDYEMLHADSTSGEEDEEEQEEEEEEEEEDDDEEEEDEEDDDDDERESDLEMDAPMAEAASSETSEQSEESDDASDDSQSSEEDVEDDNERDPVIAAPSAPVLAPEDANARRLAALEEKMKKKKDEDAAKAGGFIGQISIDAAPKGKKITFDEDGDAVDENADAEMDDASRSDKVTGWLDSDDEEQDEHEDTPSAADELGGKYGVLDDEQRLAQITGAAPQRSNVKTLDFDDDSAETTTSADDAAEWFAVRPEFLGERGKKLFELQKRFGGDQRFRMDARFIDDEENEYGGTQDLDELVAEEDALDVRASTIQAFRTEDEQDLVAQQAREMAGEVDQALVVIGEMFPDVDIDKIRAKLNRKKKKDDPIKEASWMGEQMRYDPRDRVRCAKYELSMEDPKAKRLRDQAAQELEQQQRQETSQAEEMAALTSNKERFYATTNALGNLFSRVRKNSEDGVAGEAALDGVFGFSGLLDAEKAPQGVEGDSGAPSSSGFTLGSLFDAALGDEKDGEMSDKKKTLAALGESLLEADDEKAPWHFTQAFGGKHDDEDDLDDEEEEDTDKEDGGDESREAGDKAPSRVKRSLGDFLEFGRTFVGPTWLTTSDALSPEDEEAKSAWQTQWVERRKKLTLDFKRKRRDALKTKKKQQQLQQRHHHKRQRLTKT